jgi:epoxyqueuosine reductase QueG
LSRAELDLRKFVVNYVNDYVLAHEKIQETKYRKPVIGFSDADDPLFKGLKEVVTPSHYLPQDLLEDVSTVISVFLPFSESVVKSNFDKEITSKEWAVAYTETNELLDKLTYELADEFKKLGYHALGIKTTHHLAHAKKESYSYDELFSDWSQRHVAFISGIGTFGLNNLLITVRGCAGRIGSLLTSAKIEPTKRDLREGCLVKRGIYCYKCVERCPVNVISKEGKFDRVGCMDYLVRMRKYQESIYGLKEGTQTCGKCNSNIPCDIKIPEKRMD